MRRVPVAGATPYDVVIGPGAAAELGLVLAGTPRAAVLHAPPLAGAAGAAVETLQTAGVAAEAVVVPDGESAKTAAVAASLWDEFGRLGLTRSDAVVGIGGGAVTDLAGFVAATWVRGVRVVQVPTSLLGMVDAAVGGRPGSTPPPARTWSAPSTHRPPSSPTRPSWPRCPPRSSAPGWPRS